MNNIHRKMFARYSHRVCALGVAALLQSACVAQTLDNPASEQSLAREILRELVEINTTDSVGNNTHAAEAMASRLLGAGFAEEDVEVLGPHERKGNLIARLRGTDRDLAPLLLLAHLDVVEADASSWDRNPFTFYEEDGYFYGRGVSDDKDEAAIHIANLILMKRAGYQPRRDIVVALTADEEGGSYNGVQWLLATHPEKLRAEYVLNEGGGGVLVGGQRIANEVQAAEKQYLTFRVETDSRGGHSSMPPRDNSIYAMIDAVEKLRDYEFPVTLNAVTTEFFRRSSEINGGALGDAMDGLLQDPPDPAAVEFLSQDPFYNASMRTTCVPTMIQGGHAENALPQRISLTVNCRFLPTETRESLQNTLLTLFGEDVTVHWEPSIDTLPKFTLEPEVLAIIERVSQSIWSDVPVIPIMGPGGTDGRFLRDIGTPVYGVNGIFIDVEDDRAHAKNERIRVRSFFEGQQFLYRLTVALSE